MNANKWDRRSTTYDENRFDYFRILQRRLLTLVDPRPASRFLDIGCGTGWAVRHAAALTAGRGSFFGIDISPGMIEKAQASNPDRANIHFLTANAQELPFEVDYFNIIICTNSFHHYPDPKKALREIRRVLQVGGRVYIMELTADEPVTRALNRLFTKREPEHVKFYSTREYNTLFAEAGLSHVCSKSIILEMRVHVGIKEG
jgi:ubiquinone/menaquinone biosynthesis C-methylase UbiE